jgi:hypothetical protein
LLRCTLVANGSFAPKSDRLLRRREVTLCVTEGLTMPEADASLLPVIVGGLLTMGGGVIGFVGSIIRDAVQTSHDKKKHRAQKFEELVTAVYEYDRWIDTKLAILAHGQTETIGVSPAAKIEAISAVYFPVFKDKIKQLSFAAINYEAWMTKAGMKRIEQKFDQVNDGLTDVYLPCITRRDELLDALREFASTEFR